MAEGEIMDEWWSGETLVAVAVTNDAEDGTTVVGSTWDATMTVGEDGDEVTVTSTTRR